MTHYFCTGECGGVSENSGTCQAGSCSMYNQPLKECNCEDKDNHKESEELDNYNYGE